MNHFAFITHALAVVLTLPTYGAEPYWLIIGGQRIQVQLEKIEPDLPPVDTDGDGIPDAQDPCPNDKDNKCNDPPPPPSDRDGDGIPDTEDECPDDATNKCNEPIDTDNDGEPDETDPCPHDPLDRCDDPVDPLPPETARNEHFERMLQHPKLIKAFDLRERDDPDYLFTRGGRQKENPFVVYDPSKDAAKITLPPNDNQLPIPYAPVLKWEPLAMEPGEVVTIQADFMISKSLHDNIIARGFDGIRAHLFKFLNVVSSSGSITYELRTYFAADLDRPDENTQLDVRSYPEKLEGDPSRQMFAGTARPNANDADGGGYDRHPGPDSSWWYKGGPQEHPEQFKAINDRWVRWTIEIEGVLVDSAITPSATDSGMVPAQRVKVWLADEETEPRLIIASPNDPSLGFLTTRRTIGGLFVELDTSKGTRYLEPQPERSCWVRNVFAVKARGEEVLGGKPVR